MAFSPLDLSPTMWLKADALALSDGDPVATWADSSGNGHSASQVTAGRRPVFHTNVQNGLPGVRFDPANASSLSLATLGTAIVGTSPHSWMFVLKPTSLSNYPILVTYPVESDSWSYIIEYSAGGQFYWAGAGYGIYGSAGGLTAVAHLFSLVKPSGAGRLYGAGTEITPGTTGTLPTMSGDMQLGGYATATYGMYGDFHEVIAFNSALADADRQKLEGYLAWKWGLQGSLPSDHPWKATNPVVSAIDSMVALTAPHATFSMQGAESIDSTVTLSAAHSVLAAIATERVASEHVSTYGATSSLSHQATQRRLGATRRASWH